METSPGPRPRTPEELEAEVARLGGLLHEVEVARRHERLQQREFVLGLTLENEALKDKNGIVLKRLRRAKQRQLAERRAARAREAGLRRELEDVRGSRTWRAGRMVLLAGLRGRR